MSQTRDHGGWIYVSGQVGRNPETGTIPGSFEEQARQALENLRSALTATGAPMSAVLKTTVFIRHEADFARMNEVYAEYFPEPFPARSTIVTSLARREIDFEIEAIAYHAKDEA